MRPFLTAYWTHLINITYAVDPALLMPYLPRGVNLEIIDGKAFISLVPFDFTETKFLGMKIPFHVDFPEINIRFYVNYEGKRGVVFLREYISKWTTIAIANKFYYEHYEHAKIQSEVRRRSGEISVHHSMKKNKKMFNVEVMAYDDLFYPRAQTKEYFFEERFYGYSKNREGEPLQFRVEHPSWALYPVKDYYIDFDFGFLLGDEWKFLNDAEPESVMLLNGSFVNMYPHKKINQCQRLFWKPTSALRPNDVSTCRAV